MRILRDVGENLWYNGGINPTEGYTMSPFAQFLLNRKVKTVILLVLSVLYLAGIVCLPALAFCCGARR